MIDTILGMGILVVLIVVVLSVLLYILPAIIAVKRDHRSKGGIIALNILLGWSVLAWIIALIWSLGDTGQSRM